MKKLCLILFLLLAARGLHAQQKDTGFGAPHFTIKEIPGHRGFDAAERKKWVSFSQLGAYAGTLVVLDRAWYRQYPRTRFQTFNDTKEWLQIDKWGHGWSAYQMGRATSALWQWAGMPPKNAVLLGSGGSLLFLTLIEWMDGHSQKWGWSWADMAANGGGVLLFAGQQWGWKQQRIGLKFSVAPQRYSADLTQRSKDLFGATAPERVLKDYNGQTYWLSANIHSFLPDSRLPPWLNVAVGYGASGMWGGFGNRAFDPAGLLVFDRTDIPRRRQWYLSPDVDFTKIKTNRKGVKTLLFLLNGIKLPAPALELSGKKWKGKWLL